MNSIDSCTAIKAIRIRAPDQILLVFNSLLLRVLCRSSLRVVLPRITPDNGRTSVIYSVVCENVAGDFNSNRTNRST